MKYWQESEELIDSKSLKVVQFERLSETLTNAYNNVAFYRRLFDENKVNIESIKHIEDISKLPFTYKKDLASNYPYGMFAVDLKDIVRIHSSSGTTGKPTVVGYTKRDMKLWKDMIARILVMGGLSEADIIQICFTYGLFTGGFGLHQGAEHVGATVIPASSGNTERQIMLMRDYKTTAIVASPSYALHIAEVMESEGIKRDELCLKYGFFGSEPWGETIREEIENKLGIHATDNYGLTEMMGPGVAGECLCKSGMHINEDHFFAEIINPDNLEVLPIGEIGELVLTTLTREAMPMIRYRTRDITKLYYDDCECGRKFLKMSKPIGRTDDMFIINGVNIYPSQIEQALKGITGITPHFMIYLKKLGKLDSMELQIETSDTYFFDAMKVQKEFLDKLTHKLTSALQVKPKIRLVMPKSLERFTGKAKRVVDERNLII